MITADIRAQAVGVPVAACLEVDAGAPAVLANVLVTALGVLGAGLRERLADED